MITRIEKFKIRVEIVDTAQSGSSHSIRDFIQSETQSVDSQGKSYISRASQELIVAEIYVETHRRNLDLMLTRLDTGITRITGSEPHHINVEIVG